MGKRCFCSDNCSWVLQAWSTVLVHSTSLPWDCQDQGCEGLLCHGTVALRTATADCMNDEPFHARQNECIFACRHHYANTWHYNLMSDTIYSGPNVIARKQITTFSFWAA